VLHVDDTKSTAFVDLVRDRQHYRDRPLSTRRHAFALQTTSGSTVVTLLLRTTSSGSNQLGLVAKNVKEDVWLCRYLGQGTGPDTELRRGTWGSEAFNRGGIGFGDPRTSTV
jgi:hypothetical protein